MSVKISVTTKGPNRDELLNAITSYLSLSYEADVEEDGKVTLHQVVNLFSFQTLMDGLLGIAVKFGPDTFIYSLDVKSSFLQYRVFNNSLIEGRVMEEWFKQFIKKYG